MTLNERIAQEIAEWEQLAGVNKVQMTQQSMDLFSADTRRLIIVGGISCYSLPGFMRYDPKETEAENQIEFAPVATFFRLLAADREYIDRLVEKVAEIHSLTIESNV